MYYIQSVHYNTFLLISPIIAIANYCLTFLRYALINFTAYHGILDKDRYIKRICRDNCSIIYIFYLRCSSNIHISSIRFTSDDCGGQSNIWTLSFFLGTNTAPIFYIYNNCIICLSSFFLYLSYLTTV